MKSRLVISDDYKFISDMPYLIGLAISSRDSVHGRIEKNELSSSMLSMNNVLILESINRCYALFIFVVMPHTKMHYLMFYNVG